MRWRKRPLVVISPNLLIPTSLELGGSPQRLVLAKSVVLDGAGVGLITFPAPPVHSRYLIERISVTGTGECQFYLFTADPWHLVADAFPATTNVGESVRRIEVPPSTPFLARFSTGTPGSTGTVRIEGLVDPI